MKSSPPPAGLYGARVQALLALAATCFPVAVQAATWDNSTGDGTWSSAGNWDTDVEPSLATPVVFPTALIGTGAVALSPNKQAASLQFDDAYTLSAGGLFLPAGNSIHVAGGVQATIDSPLDITGGLNKTGAGTLVLGNVVNTPGGTIIHAGKIRANHISALGGLSAMTTVHGGATLEIGSPISIDSPVTLLQGATFGGIGTASFSHGTITIDPAATAVTLGCGETPGDVFTMGSNANDLTGGSGSSVISIGGMGKVRLGAASNYAGSWYVPAGTRLDIGNATALGSSTTSNITLDGGILGARADTSTNFASFQGNNIILTASSTLMSERPNAGFGATHTLGKLSMGNHTLTTGALGSAGLVLGDITLSGDPTFATGASLTTGSLQAGGATRHITVLGESGVLRVIGGATDLGAGSTVLVQGSLELHFPNLGTASSITVNSTQNPVGPAAANVSDGRLGFRADGNNSTTPQTFIVPMTITMSGTSWLDADRRSGTATTKTFQLPGLSLAADTILGVSGANTHGVSLSGPLTLAGNATLRGSGGPFTLTGGIQAPASAQVSIVAGSLDLLVNAASTYGGGTLIAGCDVYLNAANALGTGPVTMSDGDLTVNADNAINGTLTVTGGDLRVNDMDALRNNPVNLSGGSLILTSTPGGSFITGPFSASGSIVVSMSSGVSIPVLTLSGATTMTVGTNNITQLNMGGDLTLAMPEVVGGTTRIQGITELGGPRRITMNDKGSLFLLGPSDHSGGTEINIGKLQVEHFRGLGTGSLTLGPTSGTGTVTAAFTSSLTIANDIVVRSGGSTTITLDAISGGVNWNGGLTLQRDLTMDVGAGVATYGGPISGTGNIRKVEPGELLLANATNSFGSGTAAALNVTGGTLAASSDGALGNPANGVTLAGSSQFKASSSFSSARTFTSTGATAGINVAAGQEFILNGALAGATSALLVYTKYGEGILTVSAAANSSARGSGAPTRVSAGTLRLRGTNGLSDAGPLAIGGASAALELQSNADTAFAHPLTSDGIGSILVDRAPGGVSTNGRHSLGSLKMAAGTLSVNGANGYGLSFGSTSVTGNSTLTNNGIAPLILASLTADGGGGSSMTMSFGGSGNIHINGALTAPSSQGNYRLSKSGSGTLRVGSSMTAFNALTTVSDGTLDLNGQAHVPAILNLGGVASAGGARILTGAAGLLTPGGPVSFSATGNPAGAVITGNVALSGAVRTFTVGDSSAAAIDLNLDGPISGTVNGGLAKVGAGSLRLSGAGNTLLGAISISAGTLELAKSSGDAIGSGGLSITGGVVSLLAANQIKDTAAVTVNSSSTAYLDLAGQIDGTGAITLTQSSATASSSIKTGASGTLVLNGNVTFNNNTNASTTNERNVLITGSGTLAAPSSTGTLDLGGAVRTIHCATTTTGAREPQANATIETRIINGGILKTGARTLYLTNPNNSFAGGIQVNQGTIRPTVSGALGTGPVTFANGAGVAAGLDLTDVPSPMAGDFVIGGAGDFELTYAGAVPNTLEMTGAFTLQKDLKVNVVNGTTGEQQTATLRLSGAISDGASTFGLIKRGNGVLRLAAGNTYSGATTIQDGVLRIAGDSSLGDSAAALAIDGGALWFEAGNTTALGRDVVFGANGGGIRGESGSNKSFSGNLDWGTAAANAIYGRGVVVLGGSTSGGAGTALQLGRPLAFAPLPADLAEEGQGVVLSLRGTAALPGGGLRIENAAVLELGNGDFTRGIGTGPGQFTIAERDGGGWGAHGAQRHVNLGGAAQQVLWGAPGFLREADGTNILSAPLLLGSATGTHTLVFDNPIDLNPALSDVDHIASRSIMVADGGAAIDARITGDIHYLDNTAPITPVELSVKGGGSIEFSGDLIGRMGFFHDSPATIIFSGDNELQDAMTISAGKWIFASDASVGAPSSLFCGSDGVIDASALTQPYTIHTSGEMMVDGTILGSVLAPAGFSGNGQITGDLLTGSSSQVFPNYDGTLQIGGNFHHGAGAWLDFEISGLAPETGYNRMRVSGEVELAGNVFVSDLFNLQVGQSFVFILNDGSDPISGQFNGLPEGALRHLGNGLALQFSYAANGDGGATGNDFGATVVLSPAATDRQLSGSGPLAVAPGDEIVLHYVLGTAGPGSEEHPYLSVSYPAGLSLAGSTPPAEIVSPGFLQVTLPPQAAGSTANVELRFTAPLAAPGSVRVNAAYNGHAPDPDEASPGTTLVTAILPGGQTPALTSVQRSTSDGDLEATIATLPDVHYLFEGSLELEDWYPIEDFYGDGGPVTIDTPVDEVREYFRFRIIPFEEEPVGAE